jgi:hypothetical protein
VLFRTPLSVESEPSPFFTSPRHDALALRCIHFLPFSPANLRKHSNAHKGEVCELPNSCDTGGLHCVTIVERGPTSTAQFAFSTDSSRLRQFPFAARNKLMYEPGPA